MKKVNLGSQGLSVPAIGLGCMGMFDFYGSSDEKKIWQFSNMLLKLGVHFEIRPIFMIHLLMKFFYQKLLKDVVIRLL
ncbi:MAG: hypothetical protein CL678_09520 [Bdellovibrionaceae bacterium]|nr:hypothetical protein [Pseudobdellovibrionaceae bacterium]